MQRQVIALSILKFNEESKHTHTYFQIFKIWVPGNTYLEFTHLVAQVQTSVAWTTCEHTFTLCKYKILLHIITPKLNKKKDEQRPDQARSIQQGK